MASRRILGMAGVPNAYAGGYNDNIRRQLESVHLPEKLKCKVCRKLRGADKFSKRQLDIFRNAFVVEGQSATNKGYATCRGCTGGQTMELRCSICDKTKSLDCFALSQRREHEFARCFDCVQGHRDAEPVVDDDKLLTDGGLSTRGTIASHVGSTLAGSIRRLTSDTPGGGSSLAGVTDNAPFGGGVWVEPERHDATNLSGYGSRSDLQSVSTNFVHSEWASYGVSRSDAAASAHGNDKGGKFAKIKAWKSDETEKPPVRLAEDNRNIRHSDDEDDVGYVSGEDLSDFL
ncbi:Stc1 domain-containing protein [Aspergillus venezuelensis]